MQNNNFKHISDSSVYVTYNPAGTQWPQDVRDVQKALSLIGPWALTSKGLPLSTEGQRGIIQIATQKDVDDGIDDTKAITAKKLKQRLGNPQATETVLGLTRYATSGQTAEGTVNNVAVVPSGLTHALNLRVASQTKTGLIKISTQQLADAGQDLTTAVPPALVKSMIAKFAPVAPSYAPATEAVMGLVKLASPAQIAEGKIREGFSVSPWALMQTKATDAKFGLTRMATQAEVNNFTSVDAAVTPARLGNIKADMNRFGLVKLTTTLGNVPNHALASNAPVVNKGGDNMTGRLKLNGDDYITRKELSIDSIQVGFICMAPYNSSDNYGGSWAHCDGRTMNKNTNPELFAKIGYTYGGSGDNFNLPNFNDIFARGASGSRPVGTREEDTIQNITGGFMSWDRGRALETIKGAFRRIGQRWNTNVKNGKGDDWGNEITFDASRVVRTSHETRPKNMATWYVIRIK